jgi:hypothetical protein
MAGKKESKTVKAGAKTISLISRKPKTVSLFWLLPRAGLGARVKSASGLAWWFSQTRPRTFSKPPGR